MITVSESRFLEEWPAMLTKHSGKSWGISYLPSCLKTSYMYIYIPSLEEGRKQGSATQFCLQADVQVIVKDEKIHEATGNKVLSFSRIRFENGKARLFRVEALNLDPKFVAYIFNVAVSMV